MANDKWFDELFSDLTVGKLAKEIESRMELIINNSFNTTFHSEISVNRLGDLLVATIDGVEYHVPSLLDALCNYTDEDFDNGGYYDLFDYFRDCEYTPEANASETHKEATVVASNSPFMTTQQRFLEKVETQIKDINNLCFPKSHRIKDIQVSCSQVNGQLVVSVDNCIYCAKSLLVAIDNFDVDADSEDYLNIWDYLKSCKPPR